MDLAIIFVGSEVGIYGVWDLSLTLHHVILSVIVNLVCSLTWFISFFIVFFFY